MLTAEARQDFPGVATSPRIPGQGLLDAVRLGAAGFPVVAFEHSGHHGHDRGEGGFAVEKRLDCDLVGRVQHRRRAAAPGQGIAGQRWRGEERGIDSPELQVRGRLQQFTQIARRVAGGPRPAFGIRERVLDGVLHVVG